MPAAAKYIVQARVQGRVDLSGQFGAGVVEQPQERVHGDAASGQKRGGRQHAVGHGSELIEVHVLAVEVAVPDPGQRLGETASADQTGDRGRFSVSP